MRHYANEYFENSRLELELGNAPRSAFLKAVRSYEDAMGKSNQAWLIENIIRTSRALADDRDVLPDDVRDIFDAIIKRYAAFGLPDRVQMPVSSYSDARKLIISLFF